MSRRMQGDRYAIAGERRNDGCLIADAVESIFGGATQVAVGNVSDGDRLVEQRLRPVETHREVWAILLHRCKQPLPSEDPRGRSSAVASRSRNSATPSSTGLDTTVASGIER